MFDNYVGAKNVKSSAWTAQLLLAAVVLHVLAGATLMVRTWWNIEELDRPTRASAGLSTAPPPPPPPPAGGSKKIEKKKPKVKKIKEVTQIDERKEKPKVEPEDTSSNEDEVVGGVEGGVEGGVVGGVVGGVLGGVEGGVLGGTLGGDPPPPPPPDAPKVVQQVALEAARISGDKDIQPPSLVATKVAHSGKRAIGIVKMCLNSAGNVKSLNMLKSTGYPTYDAKLKSKMRVWKYRPFKVNGKPVPVCTSVTFVYSAR